MEKLETLIKICHSEKYLRGCESFATFKQLPQSYSQTDSTMQGKPESPFFNDGNGDVPKKALVAFHPSFPDELSLVHAVLREKHAQWIESHPSQQESEKEEDNKVSFLSESLAEEIGSCLKTVTSQSLCPVFRVVSPLFNISQFDSAMKCKDISLSEIDTEEKHQQMLPFELPSEAALHLRNICTSVVCSFTESPSECAKRLIAIARLVADSIDSGSTASENPTSEKSEGAEHEVDSEANEYLHSMPFRAHISQLKKQQIIPIMFDAVLSTVFSAGCVYLPSPASYSSSASSLPTAARNPLSPLPSELFVEGVLIEWAKEEKAIHSLVAQFVFSCCCSAGWMDPAAKDAIVSWAAHHLSNVQWKFVWNMWQDIPRLPASNTRRMFVAALLERCVRLHYRDGVAGAIPEPLVALLPEQKGFEWITERVQKAADYKRELARDDKKREIEKRKEEEEQEDEDNNEKGSNENALQHDNYDDGREKKDENASDKLMEAKAENTPITGKCDNLEDLSPSLYFGFFCTLPSFPTFSSLHLAYTDLLSFFSNPVLSQPTSSIPPLFSRLIDLHLLDSDQVIVPSSSSSASQQDQPSSRPPALPTLSRPPTAVCVALVMASLLSAGSKSYSHFSRILEPHRSSLFVLLGDDKHVCSNESDSQETEFVTNLAIDSSSADEAPMCQPSYFTPSLIALRTVEECWKGDTQMELHIIRGMLLMKLVPVTAIVRWATMINRKLARQNNSSKDEKSKMESEEEKSGKKTAGANSSASRWMSRWEKEEESAYMQQIEDGVVNSNFEASLLQLSNPTMKKRAVEETETDSTTNDSSFSSTSSSSKPSIHSSSSADLSSVLCSTTDSELPVGIQSSFVLNVILTTFESHSHLLSRIRNDLSNAMAELAKEEQTEGGNKEAGDDDDSTKGALSAKGKKKTLVESIQRVQLREKKMFAYDMLLLLQGGCRIMQILAEKEAHYKELSMHQTENEGKQASALPTRPLPQEFERASKHVKLMLTTIAAHFKAEWLEYRNNIAEGVKAWARKVEDLRESKMVEDESTEVNYATNIAEDVSEMILSIV
ncbi:uncharacterized protein MONOS_1622 [Monocercomonoides exilis]|uniref:uncharacterized protein n=1 Tax=Monocercomonoides exilis TaxID=2049356 RepID=UPI00355A30FB|nr:hypothetical protein MONOS_1622 [Monocercomonoides exilis]|eukprot:MONOS_1622.1-p1 / transcript=MONOS_1622.1 / gene=MONOS_1622 / organism=Monocercomonoides_exilis_PA203 / gene_product=unspecified product / transcript_product=unspecified product / location=Mono_scaffold00029:153734-156922(-) / protein_length=1062 / sequence_SO=supercontig / SO=protein_coding / is_pseudo=false